MILQTYFSLARASLQQAISWYASARRYWNYPPNPELQAIVRQDLQSLKGALTKLEQKIIKIAAFGLVSRGKSAVLNALIGEKILETGPVHGVTKWPKSVQWTPDSNKIRIELTDTPGLDEISGDERSKMAKEVAKHADLILFIIAGDITQTEYEALSELRQTQKPLLVVFNKVDLYPEREREQIYEQLQQLGTESNHSSLKQILALEEIVMVAADPQPVPIRVEYPDGTVAEHWEKPPCQIEALRQKILTILNQEGGCLLALNALFQAKEAENNIARKTLEVRQIEAEELIWNYAKYKAIAIAVNPLPLLDILAGIFADLTLIRSLARLYGLPITSHQAGKLWRTVIASSGGILLGEIGGSLLLGLSKGVVAASSWLNPPQMAGYASAAIFQGGIAAYTSYVIGKAAQTYLEAGCSWGPLGPSTVIEEILREIDAEGFAVRLKQEMSNSFL